MGLRAGLPWWKWWVLPRPLCINALLSVMCSVPAHWCHFWKRSTRFSSYLFIYSACICIHMCIHICGCASYGLHMEGGGQCEGFNFLLPPCGFSGLNTVLLPTETPCQPYEPHGCCLWSQLHWLADWSSHRGLSVKYSVGWAFSSNFHFLSREKSKLFWTQKQTPNSTH